MTGPKILTFDIERCPHLSWHFGTRDVRITPVQNVSPSRTVCWAAKWRDGKRVLFHGEWEDSREAMLQGIRDLLDEADVVVGYNSDNFDIDTFERINFPGFEAWPLIASRCCLTTMWPCRWLLRA